MDERPVIGVQGFTLPDDNVFGVPAAFLDPCADSGYYALLKNLSRGHHVLQFSGTLTQPDNAPSTITATYDLTIAQ